MCPLCGLRSGWSPMTSSLPTWNPSSSARLIPNPLPSQKYYVGK